MAEQAPAMEGLYYFRDTPERIADGVHLISAFGNSTCIETAEGLVIVDTCIHAMGPRLLAQIRSISDQPIRYVVYTHGHFDHAFGVWAILEEAQRRGDPRPQIVAHELVPARFDRYLELDGLHDHINRIQFALPPDTKVVEREQFFYPDIVYRDSMALRLGGLTFHLHHAMGETDDATWVWIPERRTVCTGDLFLWSCPNIGNPFKVQRYETEWAEALEAIAGYEPVALAPGHGPGIVGAEAVRDACLDTARALALAARGSGPPPQHGHVGGADPRRGEQLAARPCRQAVPAADLRLSDLRRARHVAPLRRLVRRQPVASLPVTHQRGRQGSGGARRRARAAATGARPAASR